MPDNRIRIIDWMRSGMNYTDGVGLLVELTRKQTFYNLFTGKDIAVTDKLANEIFNAAYIIAGSELSKMVRRFWYWQLSRHKRRLIIS